MADIMLNAKSAFLYLIVLLSVTACVPVVVVGAATTTGKTVLSSDNQETSVEKQAAPAKPSDEVEPAQKTGLDSSTVAETTVAETTVAETTVAETTVAETTVAETTVAETTVAEKNNLITNSNEGSTEIKELVSRGWQVTLSGKSDAITSSALYFDSNDNFYGFDGCRHFRGQYKSNGPGHLLIKTLIIEAKGNVNCSNEIEANLIFVGSFKQINDAIALGADGKEIMLLIPLQDFDAKVFLGKAKFQNKKTRVHKRH